MTPATGLLSVGRGRTGLFLAGAVLVFFGERMLATRTGVRLAVDGAGAALMLLSLALRLKDLAASEALSAGVRRLLGCQLAALAALLLYALQTEAVRSALGPAIPPAGERDVYGVFLAIAWPILLASAGTPLLFLERALAPMWRANVLEARRVREALRAGLSLGLALSFLYVGNFLVTRHDVQKDLAYFRAARPGTATVAAIKRLEEPVEVVLFWPKANEVADHVRGYFTALESHTDKLKVTVADRLLHPTLAKKYKVRQDGTVVLAVGEKTERWRLGVKLLSSRRDLAKMDGEFNKRLARVAQAKRYAYLVTGHGELGNPETGQAGGGTERDKMVRKVLSWQGFKDKTLGLSEGLGSKVPEDAGMVLVLGPRWPLLKEEEETLIHYVEQGGRLLLALDPEGGDPPPSDLLARLGLEYDRALLTHDKLFLRRRFDASDRQLLLTNSFSSHPSVRTLSKESRNVAVILDRTGSLRRRDGTEDKVKGRKVDLTLRSMPDTWADADKNRAFDEATEKRKIFHLAAAVTVPVPEGADEGAEPGRVVVIADGDVLSDDLMSIRGNVLLAADVMRWLAGEEAGGGTIESEEDIPVEHTSEKDALWFHGTVFAIPLVVLVGGLAYVRRSRRRRDP